MKKIVSFIAICLISGGAMAASTARRTMVGQMVAAPRQMTASVNQLMGGPLGQATPANPKPSVRPGVEFPEEEDKTPSDPSEPEQPDVDMREKERAACINNNIGVGNTFVWASRFSNTSNYASMIEDTEHPENNVCFVRVDVKSSDSRINVSDLPSKYFEWGQTITCASWIDEKMLEKRILDAKKSARTWGTVAGAVGGAAVGVGIMELFGNRMIGGKVQGQKALSDSQLIRSQLLALKRESSSEYNEFIRQVKILKNGCEDKIWDGADEKDIPEGCSFDFDAILSVESSVK